LTCLVFLRLPASVFGAKLQQMSTDVFGYYFSSYFIRPMSGLGYQRLGRIRSIQVLKFYSWSDVSARRSLEQ